MAAASVHEHLGTWQKPCATGQCRASSPVASLHYLSPLCAAQSTQVALVPQPNAATACCVWQNGNCMQLPASLVITGDNHTTSNGYITVPAKGTGTLTFYLTLNGTNTGQTGTCNFVRPVLHLLHHPQIV